MKSDQLNLWARCIDHTTNAIIISLFLEFRECCMNLLFMSNFIFSRFKCNAVVCGYLHQVLKNSYFKQCNLKLMIINHHFLGTHVTRDRRNPILRTTRVVFPVEHRLSCEGNRFRQGVVSSIGPVNIKSKRSRKRQISNS